MKFYVISSNLLRASPRHGVEQMATNIIIPVKGFLTLCLPQSTFVTIVQINYTIVIILQAIIHFLSNASAKGFEKQQHRLYRVWGVYSSIHATQDFFISFKKMKREKSAFFFVLKLNGMQLIILPKY